MKLPDKSILELCRNMGVENPTKAVVLRAAKSLASLEECGLPVPLEVIAKNQGVKEIKSLTLHVDGLLEPVQDGYLISLNKKLLPGRRRFTLAHEIAHTYFRELESNPIPVSVRDPKIKWNQEEEHLCDVAASELLMPREMFTTKAFEYGPSVNAIRCLASEFLASFQAVAIRFCGVRLWKMAVARWELRPTGWTQVWEALGRGCPITRGVWKGCSPALFQKAFAFGCAMGKEEFALGSRRIDGFVEAQRIGNQVLAVLLFESYPEYLVERFATLQSLRKDRVWGTASMDYYGGTSGCS